MKLGPLIPVKRGRKGTYLEEWSTLTPDQLAKEMEANNGGNVALRLDNYASLDPDSQEARGIVESWEKGGILPPTVAWRTASGAIRRLFKAIPGVQRINIESIKLDLRHGNKFCDIIPPSFVHDPKKGLKGDYRWLPNLSPDDLEPAFLPSFVLEYFKRNINLVTLEKSKGRAKSPEEYLNLWRGVSEPGRNETATRLAGRLMARGISQDETLEILRCWNTMNKPPIEGKELESVVRSIEKSELKKYLESDRKISEEVRDCVLTTIGNFLTTDIHRELCLTTKDHKKAANMALLRLRDEGVIVECGPKRGCYRTIENEAPEIDWQDVDTSRIYEMNWPFELEKMVQIYPKNIIIVAGAPNSGKTAFLLNVVRMNLERHRIHFLSSEMGPEELKLRITKFPEYNYKFWKKFRPRERAYNFSDAIQPNALNIIDYFEISDNFYSIGEELRRVHDRLKDGIAVIAIQKKAKADLGRGAEFSLEKPRLYLTMEPGELKIVKAKNWAKQGFNPNNVSMKFKLINGCEFLEYE